MKLKMKNFTPAIVLGTICLIVAALLAVINHFTAPVIEKNELLAKTASLREVFGGDESGAEFGEPLKKLPEGTPSTVKEIYEEKNGMGYAIVIVIPKGFESEIDLTVGVGSDGTIKGVVVTKYEDSLGKNDMMEKVSGYKGKDASSYADVELVSGATYSSNAVRSAIGDALAAADLAAKAKTSSVTAMLTSGEASLPVIPTDDELFAFGKSKLSGASSFEAVDISEAGLSSGVKRFFKETSGKGYLVYGECFNPYALDAPEATFAFTLDKDFVITGFELYYWTLSPMYQDDVQIFLDHPEVIAFENSFVGADNMNFGAKVDLVTAATQTSSRIQSVVSDTLYHLDPVVPTETEILSVGNRLIPDAVGFDPVNIAGEGFKNGVKAIYKETSGKGYIVYAESYNPYAPASPEATFVFSVNEKAEVTGFDLLFWSLSPSYQADVGIYLDNEDVVRFEKSFVGANKMNFDLKVDHVTLATVTSERIEAAVMEALDYFNDTHETEIKVYKTVGTVIFFVAIAAIGVAIWFERRRRV